MAESIGWWLAHVLSQDVAIAKIQIPANQVNATTFSLLQASRAER